MSQIGVLVMAYGGPNSLDEVEPYLMDVRSGRPITAAIIHEVRERYRAIGGRSPILERTREQATVLEAALNENGPVFKTFVGMRHWHPYIRETLGEMAEAGVRRAVGLVMAPHYSRMSIGAYYQRLEEAQSSIKLSAATESEVSRLRPTSGDAGLPAQIGNSNQIEITGIERWHLLPGYLDALAEHVRAGLEKFPREARAEAPIIFTAHSLPQRILEWGDPYPGELQATLAAVMERLGPPSPPAYFAYQSAALTPEPWLGPNVGEVMARLAAEGKRQVLIAPIGFVSEHVEILYDVDIEFKRQAEALGLQLERIQMLNAAPGMIAGMADLVRTRAEEAGWL